jgi:hypothetical protein
VAATLRQNVHDCFGRWKSFSAAAKHRSFVLRRTAFCGFRVAAARVKRDNRKQQLAVLHKLVCGTRSTFHTWCLHTARARPLAVEVEAPLMVIAKAHSMQSVMHSVLTSWHVWVADVAQPNRSRMVRALKHFQYGFVSFGFSRWVVYHEDKCRWKHMLCVSRAHFNRNYWLRWLQVYKVPPMRRARSLAAAVA